MPELPEVETIRSDLEKVIIDKEIQGFNGSLYKGFIKYPEPETFAGLIKGEKIAGITRRGKYLIMHFYSGLNLVIHLRMTGRLIYYPLAADTDKHTHGVFKFRDLSELHFHDVRKFGTMWLVTSADFKVIKGLCRLGPEPFAAEFSPEHLKDKCAATRRPVKNLLLSQEIVAGIGNIYADEILFRAGIDPSRTGESLSDKEVYSLWYSIKKVLSEGITARGTSIRDYVDGVGEKGSYQQKLKVYGCKGKKCCLCGSLILRKKIAGRSSYYCPLCQG